MEALTSSIWARFRDRWIVAIVLVATLAATMAGYFFEKRQNFQLNQARFERTSLVLEDGIRKTFEIYAQFLRGGVALFQSTDAISREEWRMYVDSLSMSENYPGIQGVSYNAIVSGKDQRAAFETDIQQNDWPGFRIKPDGERETYVPVLYLEPLNVRNERAIGFDVYSEANRRVAIDRAIATGEASLTARITLVQEDENGAPGEVQAGALLFLPIFDVTNPNGTPKPTGLIVAVYRIGDFVTNVLASADEDVVGLMNIGLYDAASADPDQRLYQSADYRLKNAHTSRYVSETALELYGRIWTFRTSSTPAFEAQVERNSHNMVLALGALISVLCTSLVWAQAERNRETLRAADALADSKSRIEILLKEVNHRSKNVLALVQAISRQTQSNSPEEFQETFSKRLSALANSQDLLVSNEWKNVSLNRLVETQLNLFDDLIGSRIFIGGPEIELSSASAQTIGMALHEMATNASKYGALSNEKGRIDITWETSATLGQDDTFKLTWAERGGPKVTKPVRSGFGSKVTGTMVKLSLSGEVDFDFDKNGLTWTLTCPLGKLNADMHDEESAQAMNGS